MEIKEEKIAAIIKAATEEFLLKGFDAAVMENIARKSKVSKRTLYKYFPLKEMLFQTIVDTLFSQVNKTLSIEFHNDKTLEVMLKDLLMKKLEMVNKNDFIRLSKLLTAEHIKRTKPDPQILLPLEQSQNNFEQWVISCQLNNKITNKLNSKQISDWFHALFDGMILWPIIIGLRPPLSKTEQITFTDLIIKSFLKQFE